MKRFAFGISNAIENLKKSDESELQGENQVLELNGNDKAHDQQISTEISETPNDIDVPDFLFIS